MPKNKVSDPITDQEIAFAHLVFSGTMTDQRAAEAVGLNPATAAYTKSKPCVLAYMLEHRAACSNSSSSRKPKAYVSGTEFASKSWPASGKSPT